MGPASRVASAPGADALLAVVWADGLAVCVVAWAPASWPAVKRATVRGRCGREYDIIDFRKGYKLGRKMCQNARALRETSGAGEHCDKRSHRKL